MMITLALLTILVVKSNPVAVKSNSLAKQMELLTAYQVALEHYSAAIKALDGARETKAYGRLLAAAKDAHAKCEEARRAVAAHSIDEQ